MQRDHRVKWAGGLTFVGTGGSGHSVVLDSDKQVGLSPMELLLLGAGCCACVDLVMILKKARQQVVDAWVDIGGDRRDQNPRYYTDIEMHFVVRGTDIAEAPRTYRLHAITSFLQFIDSVLRCAALPDKHQVRIE